MKVIVNNSGALTGLELSEQARQWPAPVISSRVQVRATASPLDEVYRRSAAWEVFDAMTIAGQPAVRITTARPGFSYCRVVVGTAPGQGIDLDLSGDDPGVDWCGQAATIAGAMVDNLRK